MRTVPDASVAIASSAGRRTHAMHWLSRRIVAVSTSSAPALAYSSSGNPALAPASRSTRSSNPFSRSFEIVSGTSATRRSPGAVSFGTATRMRSKLYGAAGRIVL